MDAPHHDPFLVRQRPIMDLISQLVTPLQIQSHSIRALKYGCHVKLVPQLLHVATCITPRFNPTAATTFPH